MKVVFEGSDNCIHDFWQIFVDIVLLGRTFNRLMRSSSMNDRCNDHNIEFVPEGGIELDTENDQV